MRKYTFLFLFLLFISGENVFAQLTVVQGSALNMTTLQLVQTQLVGQGITVLNAAFNGSLGGNINSNQIGKFTATDSAYRQLMMSAGVILSSGTAAGAIGPNNSGGFSGFLPSQGPGDPDLTMIAGMATHDASVLEFNFIPISDTIRFNYVFGSDEFYEYCSGYNDAFGFFLSGPGITGTFSNQSVNLALMPDGITTVMINNLCNNPSTNWNNAGGINFQYDGMTYVFTAWHIVQPCQVYHIKLAVADASDWAVDSGVFLEKNSFSATGFVVKTDYSVPGLGNKSIEGCSDATVTFKIADITPVNDTIHYTITGTAINGVDYPAIPANYVVIPAGLDSTFITIAPFMDGNPEGTEYTVLSIPMITCSGTTTYVDSIYIFDNTPFQAIAPADTGACEGTDLLLLAHGSGGQQPYRFLWNTGYAKDDLHVITLPGINSYWVRVTDACGMVLTDTVHVNGSPQPQVTNSQLIFSLCSGATTNIPLQSTVPSATFDWTATCPSPLVTGYSAGTGSLIVQTLHNTGTTIDTVTFHVTANNAGCLGPLKNFKVAVHPKVTVSFTPAGRKICSGGNSNIALSSPIASATFTWTVVVSSPNTSGASAGNGNLISQVLTNSGTTIDTVTYKVVPFGLGCSGDTSVVKVIVNPPPLPVITGNLSGCVGFSTGFSTQNGMFGYTWTLAPDGTITSGSGTNAIQVNWPTTGAKTVSVNYFNPGGCTTPTPTVFNVTVHPLPVVTITGNTSVCEGSTGNVYTTAPGMTGYTWTLSAGGSIVSGGTATDQTITVLWNTSGAQSVSVNYTDSNGCTAVTPFVLPVTVQILPIPVISGTNAICSGFTTLYSAQPGMTGYLWTISPGGTLISGGTITDNTATVQWNTSGSQSVAVNFTNGNGCTALSPVTFPVNVFALPVPVVSGPAAACLNSSQIYTASPGMSNYLWGITPGGMITAGNGTSSVTVQWNASGAQNLTLNYTDGNGCTAVLPSSNPVNVTVLPVPVLTGNNSLCQGLTATYNTDAGMSNYFWSVSPGGTITSGGTAADPAVTILWNTPGSQTVSVNYTAGIGCTAALPTLLPVTVKPRPVITSPVTTASQCSGLSINFVLQADLPGSTFSWTAAGSSPAVTGFTPGNGSSIIQILSNSGFNNENVVYTVTPALNGCAGNSGAFTVTVFPVADVIFVPPTQSFCTGLITNLSFSSNVPASTYTWTSTGSSGNISGFAPGSGNLIQQTLTNSGFAIETVTYTVTPSANNCIGTANNATVTVYPSPAVSFGQCNDLITTLDAKPFPLKGGLPAGGIYGGAGVVAGIFTPATAGPGTHLLSYAYSNTWTCSDSKTQSITVLAPVAFACGNPIIDPRDNQSYPTTLIGTQCWMAANLNYGAPIPSAAMQRDNCSTEKYCLNDNPANCSSLGGLYQWDEMMQFRNTPAIQGVCPPSWHIPIEAEWNTLFTFLNGSGFAASPLKNTGFSGFNAMPYGSRFDNVNWNYNNFATFFWSSDSHGLFKAWAHAMNTFNPSVSFYPSNRSNAFSIRCMKD